MLFLDVGAQETDWEVPAPYLDTYMDNWNHFAASEGQVARYAMEQLGDHPSAVLEVGLGVAAFARQARQRGVEYWCVEPFQPMVDRAVSEGLVDPQRAIVAPIEAAELPPQYFDAVIMLMVLEHLHDPLQALRACVRAIRPGGVLYVEVPNSRIFRQRTRLRRLLGMTEFMTGHINFFTPESLSLALQQAGLTNIQHTIVSNARRGDSQLTIDYYQKSKRTLQLLYGGLARFPVDQWLGVASVLSARGIRKEK